MSVGYGAPGDPFDIDSINEMIEKAVGYPSFAYWDFFNSPDAGELMDRDVS